MFEARISTRAAAPAGLAECLDALRSIDLMIRDVAAPDADHDARQSALNGGSSQSLALRYAAANGIAQRRCDAILREADTIARTGLALVTARAGRPDAGTIAAARFLGNSIDGLVRRLETTLAPRTT
jgi:hypothetical protein